MKRIETLTPELVAAMPAVRDEWIDHGLSCEPADRARAEAGVRAAYVAAGLNPPPIVIWVPSPFGGAIAQGLVVALLKEATKAAPPNNDGVGDGVRDGVRAGVRAGVRDGVRAGVRDGVWAGVGDGVWAGVGAGVWAGVRAWGSNVIFGQHDATWLSFYDYFGRSGLRDLVAPLDGMCEVARSAGWWWPFRGFAVLTDRPEYMHLEPWPGRGPHARRLHREDGPAIRYRDGWELHYWHGTKVPADLIEQGWDTNRVLSEPNQEVRRAAIEIVGWDRFIADADLRLIDEQPDPANDGHTVALYDIPERLYGAPVRVILVTNGTVERDGTRRQFGLTVPAEINDAIAAAGWTYDLDRDTYAGLVRRT